MSKVTLGGTVSDLGSGLPVPYGLAFSTGGRLHVRNAGTGTFTVTGSHTYAQEGSYPVTTTITHDIVPLTVTSSTFAAGFNVVAALAVDAAGNLYVPNLGDATVYKVTPGGTVSPFAAGS